MKENVNKLHRQHDKEGTYWDAKEGKMIKRIACIPKLTYVECSRGNGDA